jgi:hypothetical protein
LRYYYLKELEHCYLTLQNAGVRYCLDGKTPAGYRAVNNVNELAGMNNDYYVLFDPLRVLTNKKIQRISKTVLIREWERYEHNKK